MRKLFFIAALFALSFLAGFQADAQNPPNNMIIVYQWGQKGRVFEASNGVYSLDGKPLSGFFIVNYDATAMKILGSALITYWKQNLGMYYTIQNLTTMSLLERMDPASKGTRWYITEFDRNTNNTGVGIFYSSNAVSFWEGGDYDPTFERQTSKFVTGLAKGDNVYFPNKLSGYMVTKTFNSLGEERIGSGKIAMKFIGRVFDNSSQGGANNSALYPNTYYANQSNLSLAAVVTLATEYLTRGGYRQD